MVDFGVVLGGILGSKINVFGIIFFENFLEHHFFEILHAVQAKRLFWRVQGSKFGPKRRQNGEKKQAQKQEGFGIDSGGPDVGPE